MRKKSLFDKWNPKPLPIITLYKQMGFNPRMGYYWFNILKAKLFNKTEDTKHVIITTNTEKACGKLDI